MKLTGHRKIGVIGAFWIGYAAFPFYPLWLVGASLYTFILGNTAPDTLEFSRYDETSYFKRKSLIPHRTYTHWLLLWIVVFFVAVILFMQQSYWLPLVTYALGGVLHLICDLPNPTGIPIIHPRKRRKSLKWWKSGEYENLIAFLLILLSSSLIWLWHGNELMKWAKSFQLSDLQVFADYLIKRLIVELQNVI